MRGVVALLHHIVERHGVKSLLKRCLRLSFGQQLVECCQSACPGIADSVFGEVIEGFSFGCVLDGEVFAVLSDELKELVRKASGRGHGVPTNAVRTTTLPPTFTIFTTTICDETI